MISKPIVENVDKWLDAEVGAEYHGDGAIGQDWARVAKAGEELGEAIAELILFTGQNPRKGRDTDAYKRMLKELADLAMTGVYAIQHFTKDVDETERIMIEAQVKHNGRAERG